MAITSESQVYCSYFGFVLLSGSLPYYDILMFHFKSTKALLPLQNVMLTKKKKKITQSVYHFKTTILKSVVLRKKISVHIFKQNSEALRGTSIQFSIV